MKRIITKSEKDTLEFGKKFAKKLKGGEVIGLIGNLGAGKTVFAKGLAQGLGIKKHITSPTFVLMKVYRITSNYETRFFVIPAEAGIQKIDSKIDSRFRGNDKERAFCYSRRIKNFIHIDAYRIKEPQEILDIGAREYFGRSDTVVVIEWAEKITKILPRDKIWIRFGLGKKENERVIAVKGLTLRLGKPLQPW